MLGDASVMGPLTNKSSMSSALSLACALVSFRGWQDGGSEQSMIQKGLTEMEDLYTVSVSSKTRTDVR